MNIELLKQNSEAVLESADDYDYLLEQRVQAKNKKELKQVDARIKEIKKYLLNLCKKLKKEL